MRTRFVAGRDATLRLTPPGAAELGTVASATVTIKQSTGQDLPTPVVAQPATVDGAELSFALPAAQLQEPLVRGGYLYRAVWAYVVDGETFEADQLFEVRKRLLLPTLTEAELLRHLPARIEELQESGSVVDELGGAWDDVLDDLAARGYEPDRIMDADRFRRPHRVKTLAMLAAAWGPDWREWAKERAEEYERVLEAALSAGDWYEKATEDAVQSAGETKWPSIELTR